ncbi:MAG: sugar phosphate isomerase/epimerase, partial [Hyphomicrobiales bacterium]|nr:sugar phosphate isomerase/epimerase [Hyphomicrobiales bacterium]
SQLAQLQKVPRHRLPYGHLCDAPVQGRYTHDELLHAGRAERLPPGEGAIPIAAILAQMPQDIPYALEVPMTAMTAAEGIEAVALRVREAATRLLSTLG